MNLEGAPGILIVRSHENGRSDPDEILRRSSWRTHLYLTPSCEDRERSWLSAITDHLGHHEYVSILVHPFIPLRPTQTDGLSRLAPWLEAGEGFDREAYLWQSEPRLPVLPILEPTEYAGQEDWIDLVERLHQRSVKASILLGKDQLPAGRIPTRVYVELGAEVGRDERILLLRANHVFESLLEGLDGGGME